MGKMKQILTVSIFFGLIFSLTLAAGSGATGEKGVLHR